MSTLVHWSQSSRWHHRVLGGLWALLGLEVIKEMGRQSPRLEWGIILIVASVYVVAGTGFIFRCIWARGTMWLLMGLTEFLFLCSLLTLSSLVDHSGARRMFILLIIGLATYTLLFLAISAASRFEVMIRNEVARS